MVGIALQTLPFDALWGTAIGFTVLTTAAVFAIGLASRNLSIGAYGAFLAFSHMTIEADIDVLMPIVFVVLVLVIISFPVKLVRSEGFDLS